MVSMMFVLRTVELPSSITFLIFPFRYCSSLVTLWQLPAVLFTLRLHSRLIRLDLPEPVGPRKRMLYASSSSWVRTFFGHHLKYLPSAGLILIVQDPHFLCRLLQLYW